MVGDLQELDRGQPTREEARVDLLLDVTGQEEPMAVDLPEEHDRDVVDARAPVGRPFGDRSGIDRKSVV